MIIISVTIKERLKSCNLANTTSAKSRNMTIRFIPSASACFQKPLPLKVEMLIVTEKNRLN